MQQASTIYAAYEEIKELCSRYTDPQKIQIFNNAINPARFQKNSAVEARSMVSAEIGSDDFTIGFVGSIKPRHHIMELMQGFELAVTESEKTGQAAELKLLIVGDGPKLKELKAYAAERSMLKDRVIFTGFISHDEVGTYISACDVLYGVVSPKGVSNPIKCYEYLAASRPVITTYSKDFAFIKTNSLGAVLEQITPESVAQSITEFCDMERKQLLEMGRRGREYVLRHHTWDTLPKLILKNYESLKTEKNEVIE